ncbi:alkylglycerol monooxygenase-like [Branchiostoma floridae]|uniref:Alkylglycerol monooxygenase n=1 Tax=Branchiostoma floridae TaxID=7739 RepID=A0A9J7M1B3_BRAFL|nr:alkylglycerol monooxygenase-like [Branchiostoma floridae]
MADVELKVQEVVTGRDGPSVLTGLRWLFYLVTPEETSFRTLDEVPRYIGQVTPIFFGMVFLEMLVAFLKNRQTNTRLNDSISSISAGMIMTMGDLFYMGAYMMAYVWVYENYRLVDLPWDSPVTWWTAFILAEFSFYWLHRMSHEVNILWAAHQVHHSSEDYNLTTALRQSTTQKVGTFFFAHLPLALLIPPAAFSVHRQLNLLYQFWIHTELVTSLGPLEYVLNTPSHHRVHHGRNPYCIDKNYGGVLIVFDRLFGTFAKEEEKVVYGLTHPLNTWDPIWVQLCHYVHIWKTFWATPGWTNKLSVLWKGPGWALGKPRLGCIEDIPKVKYHEPKYDSKVSWLWSTYVAVHFVLALVLHQELFSVVKTLTTAAMVGRVLFVMWTLVCVAAIMDRKPSAPIVDFTRCLAFVLVDVTARLSGSPVVLLPSPLLNALSAWYLMSAVIWGIKFLKSVFTTKTLKSG